MDARKRCWFRGCPGPGEPRPLFAVSHGLPATVRLCGRHMTVLSNDLRRIASDLVNPSSDGAAPG